MNKLPDHGPIKCRKCHVSDTPCQTIDNWNICNDPGAWGSSTPKILVLGFSKGFTQANAYTKNQFDSVAFSGMRPRLKYALQKLGLIDESQNIDSLLHATENDFAFGSLVRCSLSRLNEKNGKWEATGPLIKKAFKEEPAQTWVKTCMHHYLSNLPSRTKIVILLGNDTGYINLVKSEVRRLHPNHYHDINEVSCLANGRKWVHIAHPSGLNGHFTTWLDGATDTTAGMKRQMAIDAISWTGK